LIFTVFLINISWLCDRSWSSSFSLISIMYHNQFSNSYPCAPGLNGELSRSAHALMQHDSCYTDWFVQCTDGCIYKSCDITHVNLIRQFCQTFSQRNPI
jgi:hypothetical protein